MKKYNRKYLIVLQISILIGFVALIGVYFMSILSGGDGVSVQLFGGGDDGNFYYQQAINLANGQEWVKTSIHALILGNIIKITGITDPIILRVYNFTGYILLLITMVKIVKISFPWKKETDLKKYHNKANIMTIVMLTLYASLLMNATLSLYRDIWIYLFYALSVYFTIKIFFYKKKNIVSIISWIFSMIMLFQFRKYALLAYFVSCIIFMIIKKIFKNKKPLLALGIIFLAFGVFYTFFRMTTIPVANMSISQALGYRLSGLTTYSGGSQMYINLDQSNYISFLINYLYSYLGNLMGPLPWHISGISTLIVFFIETIPMVLILSYIFKNRKILTVIQNFILVNSFTWIGFIAITNDNIGTATRLRTVAWILIIPVYVNLLMANKIKRRIGN